MTEWNSSAEPVKIERIARLSKLEMVALIERSDLIRILGAACYLCHDSRGPLVAFRGRILCEPCIGLHALRGR